MASRFAVEPEFTSEPHRTPTNRASFRSKSSANRPVVNQRPAPSPPPSDIPTVNHLAGYRHHGCARHKRLRRELQRVILRGKVKYLLPQIFCFVTHNVKDTQELCGSYPAIPSLSGYFSALAASCRKVTFLCPKKLNAIVTVRMIPIAAYTEAWSRPVQRFSNSASGATRNVFSARLGR